MVHNDFDPITTLDILEPSSLRLPQSRQIPRYLHSAVYPSDVLRFMVDAGSFYIPFRWILRIRQGRSR